MRGVNILWPAGIFLGSFVLTGLCRHYALRVSMLDIPNARSSHTLPTPRGGGVGLVLTFLIGSGWIAGNATVLDPGIVGLVVSGALVAAVGFIDDHYHIPAVLRLTFHIIASSIFLYFLDISHVVPWHSMQLTFGWFSLVLVGITLVWMLNLYNFMDGIDGLAGGEAVFAAGGAALILWLNGSYDPYGPLLIVLGVAAAGFLVWNWPPAKIFMGDVGSGFVGFVFGCFALLTSMQQGINIWAWLILLAVFIIDATVTLLCRLLRKERFWLAHRSHAYQILSRRYGSHTKITVGVLFVNIFWLLPWAIISSRVSVYSPFCALAALCPLIFYAVMVGAGTTDD